MKKLKQYAVYNENPFLNDLKVKPGYRASAVSKSAKIVSDEGELIPHEARMVIREPIDKTNFFKIYPENLPMVLSGTGIKLFIYLLGKVEYNSTRVYFHPNEWMDEDNREKGLYYSIKTIYASLKELLDARILARSKNNFYFINPTIGFKGNRLELLK